MITSGEEPVGFLTDPENVKAMGANELVNRYQETLPFLTYAVGTEVQRDAQGQMKVITPGAKTPPVVFLAPAKQGRYSVTPEWTIDLPSHMMCRMDHGSLVLTGPGVVVKIEAYENQQESMAEKKAAILKNKPDTAADLKQAEVEGFAKVQYTLVETVETESAEKKAANILTFLFGVTDELELHMVIHYQDPTMQIGVDALCDSLRVAKKQPAASPAPAAE